MEMNNGFSSGEDSRGPMDQMCCLIDDGTRQVTDSFVLGRVLVLPQILMFTSPFHYLFDRCINSAGYASYSKRIQVSWTEGKSSSLACLTCHFIGNANLSRLVSENRHTTPTETAAGHSGAAHLYLRLPQEPHLGADQAATEGLGGRQQRDGHKRHTRNRTVPAADTRVATLQTVL